MQDDRLVQEEFSICLVCVSLYLTVHSLKERQEAMQEEMAEAADRMEMVVRVMILMDTADDSGSHPANANNGRNLCPDWIQACVCRMSKLAALSIWQDNPVQYWQMQTQGTRFLSWWETVCLQFIVQLHRRKPTPNREPRKTHVSGTGRVKTSQNESKRAKTSVHARPYPKNRTRNCGEVLRPGLCQEHRPLACPGRLQKSIGSRKNLL